jgi:hypothetical protein
MSNLTMDYYYEPSILVIFDTIILVSTLLEHSTDHSLAVATSEGVETQYLIIIGQYLDSSTAAPT